MGRTCCVFYFVLSYFSRSFQLQIIFNRYSLSTILYCLKPTTHNVIHGCNIFCWVRWMELMEQKVRTCKHSAMHSDRYAWYIYSTLAFHTLARALTLELWRINVQQFALWDQWVRSLLRSRTQQSIVSFYTLTLRFFIVILSDDHKPLNGST